MSGKQDVSALANLELALVASLRLPSLENKHCLSFGVGSDVLCGYALHEGAASATGVMPSAEEARQAEALFPSATFLSIGDTFLSMGDAGAAALEQSREAYDLISLQVGADEAPEIAFFETILERLIQRLSRGGLLVMKVPVTLEPSGDESHQPLAYPGLTRKVLARLLERCAWKVIASLEEPGEAGVQWLIVHVTHMKPYVYMLLGEPGSGKSTLMRELFAKVKVRRISGDKTYQRICQGKYDVSPELRCLVQEEFSTETIGKLTKQVIAQGLFSEIVDVWLARGGGRSFVLDSYVPESHRQILSDLLAERGYFPVLVAFPSATVPPSAETAIRRSREFRRALLNGRAGAERAGGRIKRLAARLVRWKS